MSKHMQAFRKPRSIPLLTTAALLAALQMHPQTHALWALAGSTHRHLHLLVLSRPEEREGGATAVRLILQVGINPITEVGEPSQQIFRWTKAPRGHTPTTSCSGEADNEIGILANRLIGVV